MPYFYSQKILAEFNKYDAAVENLLQRVDESKSIDSNLATLLHDHKTALQTIKTTLPNITKHGLSLVYNGLHLNTLKNTATEIARINNTLEISFITFTSQESLSIYYDFINMQKNLIDAFSKSISDATLALCSKPTEQPQHIDDLVNILAKQEKVGDLRYPDRYALQEHEEKLLTWATKLAYSRNSKDLKKELSIIAKTYELKQQDFKKYLADANTAMQEARDPKLALTAAIAQLHDAKQQQRLQNLLNGIVIKSNQPYPRKKFEGIVKDIIQQNAKQQAHTRELLKKLFKYQPMHVHIELEHAEKHTGPAISYKSIPTQLTEQSKRHQNMLASITEEFHKNLDPQIEKALTNINAANNMLAAPKFYDLSNLTSMKHLLENSQLFIATTLNTSKSALLKTAVLEKYKYDIDNPIDLNELIARLDAEIEEKRKADLEYKHAPSPAPIPASLTVEDTTPTPPPASSLPDVTTASPALPEKPVTSAAQQSTPNEGARNDDATTSPEPLVQEKPIDEKKKTDDLILNATIQVNQVIQENMILLQEKIAEIKIKEIKDLIETSPFTVHHFFGYGKHGIKINKAYKTVSESAAKIHGMISTFDSTQKTKADYISLFQNIKAELTNKTKATRKFLFFTQRNQSTANLYQEIIKKLKP